MNLILTALTLGFLGSFHCVGMCGPIALALPLDKNSSLLKYSGALIYNIGRMFTYALLGGFFGLVGESFVIAGYQQTVSIILGIAILMMVLLPNQVFSRFKITGFIYSNIAKLKQQLALLFQKNSLSSLFFIGILNGLFPCGLVYLGVAGAIATGNSLNGTIFMAMFGLGTLPAMFSLSLLGNVISINFRNKIKKTLPLFVIAMAVLLILRGMNLGIPYVSPELSASKLVAHKCCHR
jgi:sulfite exporter TauE/SafE